MFELTLFDHLRMTFGHVVFRQQAHVRLSASRARASRWLRAAEAVLMAGVVITSSGAAFTALRAYAIAAAVLAGLSMIVLLVRLTFDFERSANVHAACAAKLWFIRERYRAVLADMADGFIDVDTARRQRDGLMVELHQTYEAAPPPDPQAFERAGLAAGAAAHDAALPDGEIDAFLPASLQKTRRPAA